MRRNNAKEKNKINKNWSFEKIKIANPLGRLNKKTKRRKRRYNSPMLGIKAKFQILQIL